MLLVNGVEIEEKKNIGLVEKEITSFEGESSIVITIELPYNRLTLFSAKEGAFPNLKYLTLPFNHLVSFSAEEGAFRNLEYLSLSHNRLTSFSVEKGVFPNLKTLYFSWNQLTSFSAEEGTFPKLGILDLDRNQLTSFSAAFPNLKFLGCAHNPDLEVLEVFIPSLQELRVKNTKIRFLDESLTRKVRDRNDVEAHYHDLGTKRLVTEAFHEGNPIAEEIVAHLTR